MQLMSKINGLFTKIRFYKFLFLENKQNEITGNGAIIIARQQKKHHKIFFAFVLLNRKKFYSFFVLQTDS
jgi:hypothetical protein